MAAAHTANARVSTANGEKVVHLPADALLDDGAVSCVVTEDGQVTLSPLTPEARQKAWIAFLDHLDATPRDPHFMRDRPMNRPPVEQKLFTDD